MPDTVPVPPVKDAAGAENRTTLRTEKGLLLVGRAAAYVAYAWLVFVDVMLALRVFLLAFSANAHAGFASFVYGTSADMLAPFRGLFPPHAVSATGYLDVSALFAILIYTLLVFLIGWLVSTLSNKLVDVRSRLGESTGTGG